MPPAVMLVRTELARATVPKDVTLLPPVVVTTPESAGTVVTVAAFPVMLMLIGDVVAIEANVLTPVA